MHRTATAALSSLLIAGSALAQSRTPFDLPVDPWWAMNVVQQSADPTPRRHRLPIPGLDNRVYGLITPGVLSNDTSACDPTHYPFTTGTTPYTLQPYASEVNDWAATRLRATSTFTVTGLEYYLAGDVGVDFELAADVPHTVKLFVSSSDTPPANPFVLNTLQVSLAESHPGYNIVQLKVDPPIVLQQGENLFVAVQMTAQDDKAVGLLACPLQRQRVEHDFWSENESAPYDWVTLDSYGGQWIDLMVRAYGWKGSLQGP